MNLPKLIYKKKPALGPKEDDLKRIYDLITANFCTTVLEFGCGYSTIIIEEALKKNKERWNALERKPQIRNPNLFQNFAVDSERSWINECQQYCKTKILFSESQKMPFKDTFCHGYMSMPSILPDFIYIDGPDPKSVVNWGFDMPMSADLLFLEAVLIPGTIVLIDGRTNNARFLARNLQRNWTIEENIEQDYTLMILDEPRLGKINAIGKDILDDLKKG